MNKLILIIMCYISLVANAQLSQEERNAIRNGAEARYVYQIVDDEGVPVPEASAHVWFSSYGRPQDNADWKVQTDTNGIFMVQHVFNERFSVGVEKKGFYNTRDEIFYLGMKNLPVKDGKWQPYGTMKRIVLKRIRKPHHMKGPARTKQRKIPLYDVWMGYDLESCEFVPPHGVGVVPDVLLRFHQEEQSFNDWFISMEVSFTNCPYAGAYQLKKDMWSDLKSDYQVDTNALFKSHYCYSFRHGGQGGGIRSMLDKEDYLVFRIRTRVGEKGELLGARYGKLYGPWQFADAGGVRIANVFLNEIENDLNLEDQRTLDGVNRLRHLKNNLETELKQNIAGGHGESRYP